jgi:signal transduction histidine kinase
MVVLSSHWMPRPVSLKRTWRKVSGGRGGGRVLHRFGGAHVAKPRGASVVQLDVVGDETSIRLSIRDDGVGGADSGRGSGLVGLKDSFEVFGGTITVESPPDGGTSLVVALPLGQLHD